VTNYDQLITPMETTKLDIGHTVGNMAQNYTLEEYIGSGKSSTIFLARKGPQSPHSDWQRLRSDSDVYAVTAVTDTQRRLRSDSDVYAVTAVTDTSNRVAVKVFHRATRDRFADEFRNMQLVGDHPCCMRCDDVFAMVLVGGGVKGCPVANTYSCMVMKYMGVSLSKFIEYFSLISRWEVMRSATAKKIALSILRGLAHMHSVGIVHTDIKPCNVLVGVTPADLISLLHGDITRDQLHEKVSAVIIDFDGACKAKEMYPEMGTTGYRAPELLVDYKLGPACDIWGAFATIFESVVGCPLVDIRMRDTFYGEQLEEIVNDFLESRRSKDISMDSDKSGESGEPGESINIVIDGGCEPTKEHMDTANVAVTTTATIVATTDTIDTTKEQQRQYEIDKVMNLLKPKIRGGKKSSSRYTGKKTNDAIDDEEEVDNQIVFSILYLVLGVPPKKFIKQAKRYYTSSCKIKIGDISPMSISQFTDSCFRFQTEDRLAAFAEFMSRGLTYLPQDRITAAVAMELPWLKF
jgi:serine/threonine protein kinase